MTNDETRSGSHLAVVGGGAWGTALAIHLGRGGSDVRLWIREPELVERMLERRDNPRFLPGITVPDTVTPTSELARAVEGARIVAVAVPSHFARAVYREAAGVLDDGVPVVVATKGIEEETLALPLEVAAGELGGAQPLAVLSGPTFADEVARGRPAAVVVASADYALARRVQNAMSGDTLRMYTLTDARGVQVAGALKNVIAIAAGVVEGLGMGHNTLAALITRGLAEIRRLGVALGGRAETFSGLAGLGDLVLTCTGTLSRNRGLGVALGRGERLEDVLARSVHVAEGVRTARSARELAGRTGTEMPILEEVHALLYENASPGEAVRRLMSRPLTTEVETAPGETSS